LVEQTSRQKPNVASKYITEKRKKEDDKWTADEIFDDFDICLARLNTRVGEGWVMRLFVPGSFSLNPDQLAELGKLHVTLNR
jgi:hypothetical protein